MIATAVFIFGTIALVLAAYGGTRFVVSRFSKIDGCEDLAGSIIFRIAALHGLILALVFAQELVQYRDISTGIAEEANALADIYYDLDRYGAGENEDIRQNVLAYLREATGPEWASLASEDRLTQTGWNWREAIYIGLLDLAPETPRQETLRDKMLSDITEVAELRNKRENAARGGISPMFWAAAFAGLIVISGLYFFHAPTPLNLALLSVFGAFNGGVMLIIYAFANPFANPGAISPTALTELLAFMTS